LNIKSQELDSAHCNQLVERERKNEGFRLYLSLLYLV
jgi:hypothetical protein